MSHQEEDSLQKAPWFGTLLEWTETIVMAIALVAIVFTFFCRVITVDGSSMEPTYHNGDRVLATNLLGAPAQGDVVIVINALEEPIIKRVVATEGQTVDFDEFGTVCVDGQPLDESAYLDPSVGTYSYDISFPQTVPEGCVFVLGDNRGYSTDSRSSDLGMVDARYVIGKVQFAFGGN